MRDLTVAHKCPVEPYIKARIHTLEIQKDARGIRIPVPFKPVPVSAARIFLWNEGRIKRKRIADIRILRRVIAAHLPAERDPFLCPLLSGDMIRCVKRFIQIMYIRIPGKIPFTAAEHLQTVGALPVPDRIVIRNR